MMITRKKNVPLSWTFFPQLIIVLSVYGGYVLHAPFLLLLKKFIDNPAAIMGLISIEVYVTTLGGPFIAWLSDRIWTRFGRRKLFIVTANCATAPLLLLMLWADNLWMLVILRWLVGALGDLNAPGQALVWEVVPARQRGRSAGFLSAYMNLGNLVFFFLLLGRFDDVYFMGPFQFLTQASGSSILFWLCALLVLGMGMTTGLGIKETYPAGRTRLQDGRKPRENVFIFFVRSVFKDILARDLYPLYLLLVANVMFSFGLGMFQPLLFTEQWGYDLQMFGNTVAVGVPLGIVLSIVGGWFADRYGKMRIVLITTIGNLTVNIIYTIYVAHLPECRPSFWEIVGFGNLAFVFGAIKSASSGPLLWEYIARNRMGAASAGIGVFNSIFRNSVALFVGVWLMWWSIWFLPQAGYNLRTTFQKELNRDEVAEKLRRADCDPGAFALRPVHQRGTDGHVSRRWWIHYEDPQVQTLFNEKEKLANQISKLNNKRSSLFIKEDAKARLDEDIARMRQRTAEIEAELDTLASGLEARLASALDGDRFAPGAQILDASFNDSHLRLTVQTIEHLGVQQVSVLEKNMRGTESLLRPVTNTQGRVAYVADVEVLPLPAGSNGFPALVYQTRIDPRFFALFAAAYDAELGEQSSFALATAVMSAGGGLFGQDTGAFAIAHAEGRVISNGAGEVTFSLLPRDDAGHGIATGEVVAAIAFSDTLLAHATLAGAGPTGAHARVYRLCIPVGHSADDAHTLRYAEAMPRLQRLLPSHTSAALALAIVRKLADVLAASPIYVTIPQHEIETGAAKREYEYFFSSQILQLSTDVFGIGILAMIAWLEKRGVLHRYGAEEDQHR